MHGAYRAMTKKGTPMDLNDDLSDLLGGVRKDKPLADHTPDWYREKDAEKPQHVERCTKCGGTGIWRGGWRLGAQVTRQCFACKGKGSHTFRTSAADRAKARDQRALRQATNEAERVVSFKTENPAVWAWLEKNPAFEFAASLRNAIAKYGYLTEKQLAAVERLMARDVARVEQAKARIENAPAVEAAGVDRLKAAFDKAIAATAAKAAERGVGLTLRQPKITIGDMTISPAKADSKNPGALYVKGRGTERNWQSGQVERVYLGKIANGKFVASRECSPEQQAKIVAFVADPAAAAQAYGQETGTCCICNATLKSEWRLRGIGPICAEKFGF